MSQPNDQWTSALKAVFAKATTDADFRSKCLSDPVAAVTEASDLEPTANAQITFSEKPDGTSIVLPPFGSDPDEILDAELLDTVSGGTAGMQSHNCISAHYYPPPGQSC